MKSIDELDKGMGDKKWSIPDDLSSDVCRTIVKQPSRWGILFIQEPVKPLSSDHR